MKTTRTILKFAVLAALMSGGTTGCESTGGGSLSGGMYYGAGWYDPFYYGGYYDHGDIIVTPPPNRPERPAHPEQPIYRPPTTRPKPVPSIPSAPRPVSRPVMRR